MTDPLEDALTQAMENIYQAATKHEYYATYFLRMVTTSLP